MNNYCERLDDYIKPLDFTSFIETMKDYEILFSRCSESSNEFIEQNEILQYLDDLGITR